MGVFITLISVVSLVKVASVSVGRLIRHGPLGQLSWLDGLGSNEHDSIEKRDS